ncbi:hypothetical protein GGS20DRAFT_548384 [Poronia punctata]|nr:hypothetical protein GGS20DRAFT_548384 [Poronia punctata]
MMRGFLKVSAFLAPVLAWATPLVLDTVPTDDGAISAALITLNPRDNGSGLLSKIGLDLRVFKSTNPCGRGNITLSGQSLTQDDIGIGSGTIVTDGGSELDAEWKFTCQQLDNKPQAQLLSFHVNKVDGQDVQDVEFSVQFRQVAPVSISTVDGTSLEAVRLLKPDSAGHHPSLEDELAELRVLEEQLLALEHSIASKISHISDTFGIEKPETLLQNADCHRLKCLFEAMYSKLKNAASKLYHGSHETQESFVPSISNLASTTSGSQSPLSKADNPPKGSNSPSSEQDGEDTSGVSRPKHSVAQLQRESKDDARRRFRLIVISSVVLILISAVFLTLVGIQCANCLRRRREAQEKRHRRQRASREACNVLVATKYMNVLQWLRDSMGRQGVEDEEKQEKTTRVRQAPPDSDSEDNLSTTMEEDIAQFRAATGAISNLISTGEGRGRLSHHHFVSRPRRCSSDSTPSSIMSSAPTYRTVDETLPPYEEFRPSARSSEEQVVDGFQHRHETPLFHDPPMTRKSLDPNIESKD